MIGIVIVLGIVVTIATVAVMMRRTTAQTALVVVPALNVGADIAIGYTRNALTFHTGYMRSVLLIAFVFACVRYIRVNRITLPCILFAIYLACLVPFSSNASFSAEQYHKVFLALALFCIAYSLVDTPEQLSKLFRGLHVALWIIIGHFILVQFLKIGPSTYLKGVIYFGPREGSEVYVTYIIAYAAVLMPLYITIEKLRGAQLKVMPAVMLIAGVLVMLLIFRRGSLLACAGGWVVYTFLSSRRRILVRYLAIACIGLAALYPLYGSVLRQLLEVRGNVAAYVADRDVGRMAEFSKVGNEFLSGGAAHALFGTDVFNSAGYFNTERPVHVDYMSLLLGAGAIGLGLYLFILVSFVTAMWRRARRAASPVLVTELRAAMAALVAASMIMSLSSQIWVLTPLSTFFLFAGALLGVVKYRPGHVSEHAGNMQASVALGSGQSSFASVR